MPRKWSQAYKSKVCQKIMIDPRKQKDLELLEEEKRELFDKLIDKIIY